MEDITDGKINAFRALMTSAYISLESADDIIDGSEPVREAMRVIDDTRAEVLRALGAKA